MNALIKKTKWFIVATLAILVVGMTFFGIFGFNNTIDYSDGYELKIVIDQPLDSAKEALKKSSNDYFAEKGISVVSTQEVDDGMGIIFKFSSDVSSSISETEMTSKIKTSMQLDGVDVETFKFAIVHGSSNVKVGNALLGLAIGLVVIFVYVAFMEKIASALAVCASYVLSMLGFTALMGILRIPAAPLVEVFMVFSAVFAAILSITTVGRYKEQVKNTEGKVDFAKLSLAVMEMEKKKYILSLATVLIAGVALIALFTSNTFYAGAQLILAGVSAVSVSYYLTPLVWTAIKAKKK